MRTVAKEHNVRVGTDAIKELISYIEDDITGFFVPNAAESALKEDRKTITEKDIIRAKDLGKQESF